MLQETAFERETIRRLRGFCRRVLVAEFLRILMYTLRKQLITEEMSAKLSVYLYIITMVLTSIIVHVGVLHYHRQLRMGS